MARFNPHPWRQSGHIVLGLWAWGTYSVAAGLNPRPHFLRAQPGNIVISSGRVPGEYDFPKGIRVKLTLPPCAVGAHSAWALGLGYILLLHQGGLVGEQGSILPRKGISHVFLINKFWGNLENCLEANCNLDSGPGGRTRSTPRGVGRRSSLDPSTPGYLCCVFL